MVDAPETSNPTRRASCSRYYRHTATYGPPALVALALAGRHRAGNHLAARRPRSVNRGFARSDAHATYDSAPERVRGRADRFCLSCGFGHRCVGLRVSYRPAGTEKMVHDHPAALFDGDRTNRGVLESWQLHVFLFS